MKSLIKLSLCMLLYVLQLTSASSMNLYIIDPRNSFTKYPGTIEEMKMTVKPHGAYFEVGMYLTISPKGSVYSSEKDTLEAVLDFDLDTKAFIDGMWLFLDDSVYINAKLMDKWTAGYIYEGIVQRRRDPSILYKMDMGKYTIKIFPMAGNSSRTVKINFFVPCTWNNQTVSASLPFNILNVSKNKPDSIKVYAFTDTSFVNPVMPDSASLGFKDVYNPRFGSAKLAAVPYNSINKINTIRFSYADNSGILANTSVCDNENFYQVIINPKQFIDVVKPKRFAFLLDYDESKSNITDKEVITELKSAIYRNLTPVDSFNVFMSDDVIRQLSKKWIPADTGHIEHYFENMNAEKIRNTSNLANLMFKAVEWVNANADTANIILIANTDQHGKQDTANKIGSTVMNMTSNHITVSVCSYVLKNWVTNFIANVAYTGNDYLYSNLVAARRGFFLKINECGLKMSTMLDNVFNSVLGGFEDINMSTYLTDGYTYDKISPSDALGKISLNTYYTEFGKYSGSEPLNIEISGKYRKQSFYKCFKVVNDKLPVIYNNRAIWAGNYLRKVEMNRNSGLVMIYDIINKSLDYNILSVYTAFLATDDGEKDTLSPDSDENIPVELMYFNGKVRDGGIDLFWATASEINNYGFHIERRLAGDNTQWSPVGFVKGCGNSRSVNYYSYYDRDVVPNNTYQYVLRQVDLDGTTSSGSQIITIRYDALYNLSLEQNYPNPMGDETTIRFTLPEACFVHLDIVDINGNIVAALVQKDLPANSYEIIWDGCSTGSSKLPNGTYFCRLTAGSETRTIKITLCR